MAQSQPATSGTPAPRTIHEYVDLLVRGRSKAWHLIVAILVPIIFGILGGSGVIEWIFSTQGAAASSSTTYFAFCSVVLIGVLVSSAVFPRTWMVFQSTCLGVVTLDIVEGLAHSDSLSGLAGFVIGLVILVPAAVVSVLAGLFVVFVRRSILLQTVLRKGLSHCPNCRYSLEGLDWKSATCPECGLELWQLHILFSR